jgi:hypothetical protein
MKQAKKRRITKEEKKALEDARHMIGSLACPDAPVYDSYDALGVLLQSVTTEPTPEEKAAAKTKAEYAAIEAERKRIAPENYVQKAYPSGSTCTDQIVLAAVRMLRKEIADAARNSGYPGFSHGQFADLLDPK